MGEEKECGSFGLTLSDPSLGKVKTWYSIRLKVNKKKKTLNLSVRCKIKSRFKFANREDQIKIAVEFRV